MRILIAIALLGSLATPADAGFFSDFGKLIKRADVCRLANPPPLNCRPVVFTDCFGVPERPEVETMHEPTIVPAPRDGTRDPVLPLVG